MLPLFLALELPSLFNGAEMPIWLAAIAMLVLRDALEYFYHRAQHSIPLLWSMHSLHHSDPNMSALTTNRHFWGDQLIKAVTIWPLAALVIAPTPLMIGVFNLASLWHIVVHARLPIASGHCRGCSTARPITAATIPACPSITTAISWRCSRSSM